jgi:predicted RNase H-like HicB family nuclease
MSSSKSNIEYQVVFQEETEGGFSVWVPDLPGCASQGETLEEALGNIKKAIEFYLEDSNISEDVSDYEYKRQFVVPVKLAHA